MNHKHDGSSNPSTAPIPPIPGAKGAPGEPTNAHAKQVHRACVAAFGLKKPTQVKLAWERSRIEITGDGQIELNFAALEELGQLVELGAAEAWLCKDRGLCLAFDILAWGHEHDAPLAAGDAPSSFRNEHAQKVFASLKAAVPSLEEGLVEFDLANDLITCKLEQVNPDEKTPVKLDLAGLRRLANQLRSPRMRLARIELFHPRIWIKIDVGTWPGVPDATDQERTSQ